MQFYIITWNKMENVKVSYSLVWITDALSEDIKKLVQSNIEWKVDTYLNKILSKKDAEITIEIVIEKTKQWKFDWSFRFNLDWKPTIYKRVFENAIDLVNHAFEHLKEELSWK
jgi:hypothetical protein